MAFVQNFVHLKFYVTLGNNLYQSQFKKLPFKMLNVTGAPVGTHFTSSNPKN